jgi:soluble lytic murein transglycosylase-like protein
MFDDFVITAGLLKLGYAILAITMLVFLSRWLDARASKALAREDANGFGAALAQIRRDGVAAAIYYGLRFLALGIVVAALMGCTPAIAGTAFPARYDGEIARAVATYWPDYPRVAAWKAQLYQESRLDPRAVSPVGAAGLAQIMPATWTELTRELRLGGASPHHDIAIQAGAYYMAKQRQIWRNGRDASDRQPLAQASYNAGAGNIIKAQKVCGGARLWAGIAPCLGQVTGHHSRETLTYVERINKYQAMMEAGL